MSSEAVSTLLMHLYKEGVINEQDLSNFDSQKTKILRFLSKNKIEWSIIVDHRDDLLDIAEEKNDYKGLTIALYATYVEHTLNKIIHLGCMERNIDFKTQKEIIRSSIDAKCTWLIKLLGLKPIKAEYIQIIHTVSEERNAFLHYKWQPEKDDTVSDVEKEKKDYEDKIKKIKTLVKYLKTYESRIEFKGKKGKINKSL